MTEAICRRAVAASVSIAVAARQGGGRGTEGEEGRERLEPAAASALLLAADEKGLEPAAAPDDQRAGAGHPAELVRTDADEVGVERGQVRRHVAARRRGVDMHRDAGRPAQRHHLAHGLERPHLVVAPLAVHQRRARPGGVLQALPQRVDLEAVPMRPPGAPRWGRARAEASRTAECSTAAQSTGAPGAARVAPQTAALMASVRARGEDHLAPDDAEEFGHLAAGDLERVADDATLLVHPVRDRLSGGSAHRVSAARASGRGGVVLAWSR